METKKTQHELMKLTSWPIEMLFESTSLIRIINYDIYIYTLCLEDRNISNLQTYISKIWRTPWNKLFGIRGIVLRRRLNGSGIIGGQLFRRWYPACDVRLVGVPNFGQRRGELPRGKPSGRLVHLRCFFVVWSICCFFEMGEKQISIAIVYWWWIFN